jgi:hypothetical protein
MGMVKVSVVIGVAVVFLVGARAAAEVDQSDPVRVVQALFDAARTGQLAPLGGLCDPQGENDGDTRNICNLAQEGSQSGEFVQYFRSGRVNGQATVNGSRASVPILFGPDGRRPETMQLIKRGNRWYLFSF